MFKILYVGCFKTEWEDLWHSKREKLTHKLDLLKLTILPLHIGMHTHTWTYAHMHMHTPMCRHTHTHTRMRTHYTHKQHTHIQHTRIHYPLTWTTVWCELHGLHVDRSGTKQTSLGMESVWVDHLHTFYNQAQSDTNVTNSQKPENYPISPENWNPKDKSAAARLHLDIQQHVQVWANRQTVR